MNPWDELRLAAEKLRKRAVEPFRGEKSIHPSRLEDYLWLASMPGNAANALASMLENLAHTWDQNEWDTNENALTIARQVNV